MHDLPPPVQAYISTYIIGARMPAYLLVDRQYRVIDWGGEVAFYGLDTEKLAGLQPVRIHH